MRSSSYTVHLMKDYKEELTNELAEFEKKGASAVKIKKLKDSIEYLNSHINELEKEREEFKIQVKERFNK